VSFDRRDFFLGAACLAAAGASEALVPRQRVSLLGARKLGRHNAGQLGRLGVKRLQ
jgi:hypothetical protein